jgi:hypothetical protein
MDHDTVYVVERHDDDYHGPNASRIADGAGVAMRVAEAMRDEHRADEWAMHTSERDDRSRVAFHPRDGSSGWVAVTEKPLISD